MDENDCSPLCTIFLFIMVVIFTLCRNVDDNGMDDYDRYMGIAGEGRERGITGIIYTNGQYDFWANLGDHNPWWD